MNHIVRLGPSIFDNAAYVAGEPEVRAQRKEGLPRDWRVMLLPVDGDRTQDVRAQPQRLPRDGSPLVVRVGGNDALDHVDCLSAPAPSVADVLGD